MPCRVILFSLVLLCAACAGPMDEPSSLETLNETQWLLRSWDGEESAPAEPLVTLTYSEGRFAGRSGCNSYSGPVEAGELAGAIVIGPIVGTRMACPELDMQVETRYLTNLQAVTKYRIQVGDLALTYKDEAGEERTMLFSPQ